jgi:prepilin-type N-terminal cleavage/methylation domain-containing protein
MPGRLKRVDSRGFTLIELLVTVVLFVLTIFAAANIFTGAIYQFKQQSKIVENQIEGMIGLEILRQDLEHAGFGLPWNLGGATYNEATDSPQEAKTEYIDRNFNDGPPNNCTHGDEAALGSHPPAGVRSNNGDNLKGVDCSDSGLPSVEIDADVLVIKAMNIARNAASQRWTRLKVDNDDERSDLSGDAFVSSDRVFVMSPGSVVANSKRLIVPAGNNATGWYATYSDVTANTPDNPYLPLSRADIRLIYGIKPADSPATEPRMPFNRADYYVRVPSGAAFPSRCAAGTGILYKGQMRDPAPGLCGRYAGGLPLCG